MNTHTQQLADQLAAQRHEELISAAAARRTARSFSGDSTTHRPSLAWLSAPLCAMRSMNRRAATTAAAIGVASAVILGAVAVAASPSSSPTAPSGDLATTPMVEVGAAPDQNPPSGYPYSDHRAFGPHLLAM